MPLDHTPLKQDRSPFEISQSSSVALTQLEPVVSKWAVQLPSNCARSGSMVSGSSGAPMISASSKCWVDSFHANVAGLSRCRKILDRALTSRPFHKLLPKVHHAKRAAGKLDPVVIDDGGVLPITE